MVEIITLVAALGSLLLSGVIVLLVAQQRHEAKDKAQEEAKRTYRKWCHIHRKNYTATLADRECPKCKG